MKSFVLACGVEGRLHAQALTKDDSLLNEGGFEEMALGYGRSLSIRSAMIGSHIGTSLIAL
jgi:hypothetical protein